jgi:hypothetical protein
VNQLSWLIYLAGVANYLSGWFIAFAIVTFVLTIAVVVWTLSSLDQTTGRPPRVLWISVPLFIFFLIGSCIVPDRQTVLAIAASQLGEAALHDPRVNTTANKAFDALNHWLDQQSKPDTPSKKDDD